ncbi:helix-turn-helix domain-containing protein [Mycolicibacterium austroafricanum]|uniref:helix-turn-helix domain-containing protein n=1 Tax=Mycolicibacterium austroafricanum TaxID=39687 RepID=UPI001CA36B6B|nr:helix-turn-helix domain-containing protein [Mycolicibacterium austroafricanum]QZT61291.1 helix-turn-helix domain-containing protein [Mycolicibacterium austroafricanum]
MSDKGLFNKDSAADYLSTSARRVDELRRAGILIARLDGREWKYARQDLDDYIDSLPTSEPTRRAS